jgi:hypothetical protein
MHRTARLSLAHGQVALVPGFLTGVLPVQLVFPLDLDLSLSSARWSDACPSRSALTST